MLINLFNVDALKKSFIIFNSVKKYSGETVAEDLDREQLAARFPEMAQNLEG